VCYSVSQCVEVCSWGWVFLRRTQILSRFQFSRHFIEFFVDSKNFLFSSNSNVILTLQTCGQRSSMFGKQTPSARILVSKRMHYMFLISKCRESNLYLCTILILAKRMPLRGGNFRLENVFDLKTCQDLRMRSSIFFASTEVVHRPKSGSPLHCDMGNL